MLSSATTESLRTNPAASLAVFRVAAGLSRAELASQAGCHRETVGRYERREHSPTKATAEALAAVLNVDPAILFPEGFHHAAR